MADWLPAQFRTTRTRAGAGAYGGWGQEVVLNLIGETGCDAEVGPDIVFCPGPKRVHDLIDIVEGGVYFAGRNENAACERLEALWKGVGRIGEPGVGIAAIYFGPIPFVSAGDKESGNVGERSLQDRIRIVSSGQIASAEALERYRVFRVSNNGVSRKPAKSGPDLGLVFPHGAVAQRIAVPDLR